MPDQQKPKIFQEVKKAFHGCLSNTTIHGLPRIVKPGNLFLNVVWVIFYAVAVSGCGFLIHQAVDQYFQYDVITMTKINRETEMTLPVITICSQYENTYDMIIECRGPSGIKSKINKLELYDRFNHHEYCVQLSYGTNVTELQSKEGEEYGYVLSLFKYENASLYLAISENRARLDQKRLEKTFFLDN